MPFSKFIIEIVENALAEESDLKPRGEIVKELSRLKEENQKMADDLRLKNIVLENYEKELNRYRGEPFLIDEFQGSPLKLRGDLNGLISPKSFFTRAINEAREEYRGGSYLWHPEEKMAR